MASIKVGISIGDYNGIGLEVVIKSLMDKRMLSGITPVIYGSGSIISYHKKALNIKEFNAIKISSVDEVKKDKINLITCWDNDTRIQLGESTTEAGKHAYLSLKAATDDLAQNKIDVIVTAPINKENIQSDKFEFPGHTEYFTQLSNEPDALMLMVSDRLKVGVVSGHESLAQAVKSITQERILSKLRILNQSLIKDFQIRKPKIAVLGLNPHAGEKGVLGSEEIDTINPAINIANEEGIMAFGPYPSDGFFGSENIKNFDAVLAMYHDQGLTPFKALSFGQGVNYTAGLPIIRTSPDHGTGYDIAGKNKANESSFRNAIYLAKEIHKNRTLYKEINQNPLKTKQKEAK